MTKQQFLDTLRQKISILEESEQQDMLEEYAQHIDMGMASGLTEEEAVSELGDPDALAAEILEAYHVNPRYISPAPKKSAAIQEGFTRSAGFFQRLGHSIASGFRRFFCWLGRGFAAVGRGFAGLGQSIAGVFRRSHKAAADAESFPEEPSAALPPRRRKKPDGSSAVQTLRHAAAAFLRFCVNAALVCLALPLVFAVLSLLLGTGTLLVLVALGYPLVGPLLCCLGASVSSAALLLLIATLFRRKKADLPPAPEPDTSLEVNPYA